MKQPDKPAQPPLPGLRGGHSQKPNSRLADMEASPFRFPPWCQTLLPSPWLSPDTKNAYSFHFATTQRRSESSDCESPVHFLTCFWVSLLCSSCNRFHGCPVWSPCSVCAQLTRASAPCLSLNMLTSNPARAWSIRDDAAMPTRELA